ncbi:unnamed protein product [Closterium sp. NIES-53]
MLLVDFRKAFDSVSRDFIFSVLWEMGFPERFVGWVEGLHKYTKTRLLINAWLGEVVNVRSGVRQGCPLPPYLFLCAVEPLAHEAMRRKLGLCNKAGQRLVYLGYADDTTLFLEGKRQIARAEKLLDYFTADGGVLDPDVLLACLAARRIGGMLLKENGKKQEIMLKAVGLPLGNDTFTAHEKLLKHWPGDGERWKQTCEVFMKSPLADTGKAVNKEAVEAERTVFNRHILLNGTTRIGGQKEAKGLWETRLDDLVTTDQSGAVVIKEIATLERELRGKVTARLD